MDTTQRCGAVTMGVTRQAVCQNPPAMTIFSSMHQWTPSWPLAFLNSKQRCSLERQFRWLVGGMEERGLTKKPALMVIAALIATHPVSDAEGMAPNAPEIWAAEGVGTCLYQIGSDKELADEDASYLTCLSKGANWCLYEARKQGIYDMRPYGAICWQKEADVWKESLSHLDDSLETNLKAMPHETGREVPSREDVIEAFSMAREGLERLIDARCALSTGASADETPNAYDRDYARCRSEQSARLYEELDTTMWSIIMGARGSTE